MKPQDSDFGRGRPTARFTATAQESVNRLRNRGLALSVPPQTSPHRSNQNHGTEGGHQATKGLEEASTPRSQSLPPVRKHAMATFPFIRLQEGQEIAWNPKYHSIDDSRADEGFYGVRNALGPGTKSLFISSFEAEELHRRSKVNSSEAEVLRKIPRASSSEENGLHPGFNAVWAQNPLSYAPLETAMVKRHLRHYYTREPFVYCVPNAPTLTKSGTLLALDSNVSFKTEKERYAYLRAERTRILRAEGAMQERCRKTEGAVRTAVIVMLKKAKEVAIVSLNIESTKAARSDFLFRFDLRILGSAWNDAMKGYFKTNDSPAEPPVDWESWWSQPSNLIYFCKALLRNAEGLPSVSESKSHKMANNLEGLQTKIDEAETARLESDEASRVFNARWTAYRKSWEAAYCSEPVEEDKTPKRAQESARLLKEMPPSSTLCTAASRPAGRSPAEPALRDITSGRLRNNKSGQARRAVRQIVRNCFPC